jgi:hypothetical protein
LDNDKLRVTIQGRRGWKFSNWDSQESCIHHTVRILPCDFWLIGFVKEKLKGSEHRSRKRVFKAVLAILAEIQRSDFIAVHEDWIERLKEVIETGAECFIR